MYPRNTDTNQYMYSSVADLMAAGTGTGTLRLREVNFGVCTKQLAGKKGINL